MKTEIGRVESFDIWREDHGLLIPRLVIVTGPNGEGYTYGDRPLDTFSKKKNKRVGTAGGMDFIITIMRICKANSLSKIPGKYLQVLINEDGGPFDKIIGFRQLPVDGKEEFIIEDWAHEYEEEYMSK